MKKRVLFLLALLISGTWAMYGQKAAIKSNLIADFTTTFNLATEFGLGSKTTLDLYANYNPWTFDNGKKFKHFLFQPEVRHWFCDKFNGHFVGLHGHVGVFNVGGVKMPFGMWNKLRDNRYEGNFYGGGVSYGYQWILGKHWNLEANIGVGYAYIRYDQYECGNCGERIAKGRSYNYFGPTKAAISLMYVF
ncbi:MAG: DUF3575 domain-containing protein [Bacteroides sp.]|nr:DUF3575 domain-containing protein [Bacteroides sp.]